MLLQIIIITIIIIIISILLLLLLLSSSSGHLLPGRSKCPMTPLFSILCLFLEFPVSVLHHPVHEILSRPSSSSLPLFPSILLSTISLCRELHLRKCPTQFFCLVGLYMKVYLYAWGKRDYCSEPAVATVGRDVGLCADLGRYIHIVLLIE